jgi:hypothetical protein
MPPRHDVQAAPYFGARVLACVLATAAFVGIAIWAQPTGSSAHQGAPPARPMPPIRGPAYLGQLEGRDHIVKVYSTADGPRYTVCDHAGRVLARGLAADGVYRDFPGLDIGSLHAGPGGALMLAEPRDHDH